MKLEAELHQQKETIAILQEKLEAFAIRDERDERNPRPQNRKKCNFCKKFGHIQKDCWDWKAEQRSKGDHVSDVYCDISDNNDIAVTVSGSLNGKEKPLLIMDTGAGPSVIDMNTLDSVPHGRIDYDTGGKDLKGVGSTRVIGTVTLEVTLHPRIKKRQLFNIVEDLGGTVLLGRSFLRKFEKFEVNWKEMSLKIDNILT